MTTSSDPYFASDHLYRVEPEVDVDVLVIGAGPTGLTAAAEALRHGLSVRIVERKAMRDGFSKALVVHARTMETFSFMGIDREVRAVGATFAALNLNFNNRKRTVRVDLVNQPWGDTEFPYWLSVPQYDTERVLEAHLVRLGGEVEWSRPLLSVTDHGDVVEAIVGHGADHSGNKSGDKSMDKGNETIRARWVIGCDGGRSVTREQAGITLKRTGAATTFLLADVKTTSGLVEDEGHMYLAQEGLLILVPMPEPGRWRVIARIAAGSENPAKVDSAFLDELILLRAGITFGAHDIAWTSQFDLSHGVADRFSAGRIFVAGDAAHVHSPVGGQGLNTGVQDAYNLMWRLAESLRATPEDAEKLLRGYESERRGTAGPMVRGVARMTAVMTSPRGVAQQVRSFLAPLVISRRAVQAKLARGVGMLNLSYATQFGPRGFALWGEGRRLPNPMLANGGRLYDRLTGTGYSWVVRSNSELGGNIPGQNDPKWMGLPVVLIPEPKERESARSRRRNRVVLVRPDRYIAAVGPNPESLHYAMPRSRAGSEEDAHPFDANAHSDSDAAAVDA